MRKMPPGITWYTLLSISIVLLLGACMKPVDFKPSPGDGGDGNTINNGKAGAGIDLELEEPEDLPPVLEASVEGIISPVAADETVLVSLNSLGANAITVINMPDYDAVEWHYNSDPVEKGATFTLGSMPAVFKEAGIYPVTAVGKKGVEKYSVLFYIKVES